MFCWKFEKAFFQSYKFKNIFSTSIFVISSYHMHYRNNTSCVLPVLLSCGLFNHGKATFQTLCSQEAFGYDQQARNQYWTSPDFSLWWYTTEGNLWFFTSYQKAFLICSLLHIIRAFFFSYLDEQDASAFSILFPVVQVPIL